MFRFGGRKGVEESCEERLLSTGSAEITVRHTLLIRAGQDIVDIYAVAKKSMEYLDESIRGSDLPCGNGNLRFIAANGEYPTYRSEEADRIGNVSVMIVISECTRCEDGCPLLEERLPDVGQIRAGLVTDVRFT
jgi:hypothetical protein